jgi:hypothetical protein
MVQTKVAELSVPFFIPGSPSSSSSCKGSVIMLFRRGAAGVAIILLVSYTTTAAFQQAAAPTSTSASSSTSGSSASSSSSSSPASSSPASKTLPRRQYRSSASAPLWQYAEGDGGGGGGGNILLQADAKSRLFESFAALSMADQYDAVLTGLCAKILDGDKNNQNRRSSSEAADVAVIEALQDPMNLLQEMNQKRINASPRSIMALIDVCMLLLLLLSRSCSLGFFCSGGFYSLYSIAKAYCCKVMRCPPPPALLSLVVILIILLFHHCHFSLSLSLSLS